MNKAIETLNNYLECMESEIKHHERNIETYKKSLENCYKNRDECIDQLNKAYNEYLSKKYVGKCFKAKDPSVLYGEIAYFKIEIFINCHYELLCIKNNNYISNPIQSMMVYNLFNHRGYSELINTYEEITEEEFNSEYNKYINKIDFEDTSRIFSKGDVVAHFKRELLDEEQKGMSAKYLYLIRDIAINTETEENMVVYVSMEDTNKVYVRPYDMFCSEVDHKKYPNIKQKYRFVKFDTVKGFNIDYYEKTHRI